MARIKVLLHSIWYPLSISRYWENALRRNPNIDLITCGIYTGSFIPWMGGMNLSEKYARPPTYAFPFKPGLYIKMNYEFLRTQMPYEWKPDLILSVDGGENWRYKPNEGIVATVATDGHCVDYTHARSVSDYFFNMHPHYAVSGDELLHYAFDPGVHYPTTDNEKDVDAVLIGMPYPQRIEWVNKLRERGVSVIFENGPVFDEYRQMSNRAVIGLNWASLEDTNARFFETLAYNLCLVTNITPDIAKYGFEEGHHFLGFRNMDEAVEKVVWAKEHPDQRKMIALAGYQKVTRENWTYDKLVLDVLRKVGLM